MWLGRNALLPQRYTSNSNMTSFFRFVNKRASYPFGIISLAHASGVSLVVKSQLLSPLTRVSTPPHIRC